MQSESTEETGSTSMGVTGRNEEERIAKERYDGSPAAAAVRKTVESVRIKVKGATTKAEFEARVPTAERGVISQKDVLIMPVGPDVIKAVRTATGKDVTGYYHSVSEDKLWHAMQGHSRDSLSTRRKDQLDLTWNDFSLLPDILDTSVPEVKQWKTDTIVTYTKDYGNVRFTVIQRVSTKHRYHPNKLMFVTEWIQKSPRKKA